MSNVENTFFMCKFDVLWNNLMNNTNNITSIHIPNATNDNGQKLHFMCIWNLIMNLIHFQKLYHSFALTVEIISFSCEYIFYRKTRSYEGSLRSSILFNRYFIFVECARIVCEKVKSS